MQPSPTFAADPGSVLVADLPSETAPWLACSTATPRLPYVAEDELGNVTHLTDQNGNVLERYDYEGYGKFRIFDPNDNPLSTSAYGWTRLFQGREYIPMLDAYDFRARTLWPELGRFGQEDPAGTVDSTNRYQALGGRWNGVTDPNGKLTIIVHGTTAKQDFKKAALSPYVPGGDLYDEVVKDLRDYTFVSFQWSGANTAAARRIAADSLVRWIKQYKFREDEPLRIFGHSHGGSVILAAMDLGMGRVVDDIVLMSTPIRQDYPSPSVHGVRNLINVSNIWEPVQSHGGNTRNIPGIGEEGKAGRWIAADHTVEADRFSLNPISGHGFSRTPQVFRERVLPLLSSRRLPIERPKNPELLVWFEAGP